jgi:hypothetical protein
MKAAPLGAAFFMPEQEGYARFYGRILIDYNLDFFGRNYDILLKRMIRKE